MRQIVKPRRGIEYKPVPDLLLDSRNPRLPKSAVDLNQIELLKLMERDFDLLPIGQSMVDNGYFVEEPLIVIPKPDEDKFITVEGNRRLAALKLLTDPELRKHSRQRDVWEKLAKAAKYPLSEVPIIMHQSRDDLIAILGFRHIAGIMKWDPLAKARFIHDHLERRDERADFKGAARQLGSRSSTIRDNYVAYRTFLQARDDFDIGTSKLEENFSVFYRALNNANIQKFIGLDKLDKRPSKLKKPISEKKKKELNELIEFVHGTSEKGPVMTDSRQLTQLGEVLASPEALSHLRLSRHLRDAYSLTGGEQQSLIDSLNAVGFNLSEALRYVHRYKKNPEVARVVERCADSFFEVLRHFPEIKDKFMHES